MYAMGIGDSYAKTVCGARTARFPAVAVPASAIDDESALGRGPAVVQLNSRGDWLVGEDALTFAPQRLVSILDRTRGADPSFVALARAALAQTLPNEEGGTRNEESGGGGGFPFRVPRSFFLVLRGCRRPPSRILQRAPRRMRPSGGPPGRGGTPRSRSHPRQPASMIALSSRPAC
jgi:hypothetical protein